MAISWIKHKFHWTKEVQPTTFSTRGKTQTSPELHTTPELESSFISVLHKNPKNELHSLITLRSNRFRRIHLWKSISYFSAMIQYNSKYNSYFEEVSPTPKPPVWILFCDVKSDMTSCQTSLRIFHDMISQGLAVLHHPSRPNVYLSLFLIQLPQQRALCHRNRSSLGKHLDCRQNRD